jgi:molybdopterin molybdotransferase
MLGAVTPLGPETVDLAQSLGRVLAEDVLAIRPQPPFDASAMDGWAVRSADGAGARRIIGESAAGRGFDGEVRPGEAVRIFTGAPMPTGADAVIIQEDARRDGDLVSVSAAAQGAFVRPAGQDFPADARLLEGGVRLDPWRLALAAAAGRAALIVARRPGLTIISTGDELAARPARGVFSTRPAPPSPLWRRFGAPRPSPGCMLKIAWKPSHRRRPTRAAIC